MVMGLWFGDMLNGYGFLVWGYAACLWVFGLGICCMFMGLWFGDMLHGYGSLEEHNYLDMVEINCLMVSELHFCSFLDF
jgi:hypothetical protein